jgi:sulfite reductase (NADPH) hemoprotein beta-component
MDAVTLGPPSDVERIKTASRLLRGTLEESLNDAYTGALRADDTQLIKFHGSYQQDDRELRNERELAKLEPAYSFMIRTRTPGGVISAAQWLALDAIARKHANGSLRLTTRQAFQIHGVIKRDLKPTLQAINAALIDTLAACGDVNRNLLIASNVDANALHALVYAQALALGEHLLPRTRAYYQLWLDEEEIGAPEVEPIYGATYLPRKFKIGFAVPPSNDVDLFSQDLGYAAIVENGALIGYNVSAGGGLGTTHGDARTYARLADTLGFIGCEHVIAIGEAVLTTQRDFGNRSDRKLSRLKYTIDRLGVDVFKAEVERRAGVAFAPARTVIWRQQGDRFGWTRGTDGTDALSLRIQSGRIADKPGATNLTGLREIARIHEGTFRLTPNQNLIIAGITAATRAPIAALVREHGLDLHEQLTPVRLNSLACVALPTCPLAMAEAERYLPAFGTRVEELLEKHGLAWADIGVRISGCPNGCSRPFLAEIGLVGKAPGRYNLHLGGDRLGLRLNRLYRENIDETEILTVLGQLFAAWARERAQGEGFGDYTLRCVIAAGTGALQ